MELNEEQKRVIEAPEPRVMVLSAASSGKTVCIIERVRWWLQHGVAPSDICLITYTNMAAGEMRIRLGNDYKDGLYIGTIHSLAARFLSKGGKGAAVRKLAKQDEFDEFFTLLKENPNLIEHYKYCCIDEVQDISYSEYEFVFNMIRPENFLAVGDAKQCIYSSDSVSIIKELQNRSDVVSYELNKNHRNAANILQYAKSIIAPTGERDNSISVRGGNGIIYEGSYNIDTLVDFIEENGNYSDWGILAYTNRELDFIKADLRKCGIPFVSFRQSEITNEQLEKMMSENKVKLLTIWSAKGLTIKNVAVYGKSWVNDPAKRCRVDYVAATRAKDILLWFKPVYIKKTRKR